MKLEDERVESFFPECAICGEKIDGDGYKVGADYICDCCMDSCKIDGYAVAEERREAAYEDAQERQFELAHDNTYDEDYYDDDDMDVIEDDVDDAEDDYE